jgi:hypothetical protein
MSHRNRDLEIEVGNRSWKSKSEIEIGNVICDSIYFPLKTSINSKKIKKNQKNTKKIKKNQKNTKKIKKIQKK